MDIIIGAGEIGRSLYNVLRFHYQIQLLDKHESGAKVDKMHICFPYSKDFIKEVDRYQTMHCPEYTIIHSTVPVGTSRKCAAIHSPVTGIHPHLELSLKTFTKYLAGDEASEVADYFRKAGFKVYLFDDQESTELGKLAQTTFYALMIEYIKNLKHECDRNCQSFAEVYTLFAQNYNKGYEELGCPEYKMPLLNPIMKKQGGHCTISNLDLWETDFTKFIKEQNEKTA